MKVMTKKKHTQKKHKHEWRRHYSAHKPFSYSHTRCSDCGAMKTEDITDFTLREPNLPALYKQYLAAQLKYSLKHDTWLHSKSEIRAFWAERKWYKMELLTNITDRNGKVVAKKGDTVWAQYQLRRDPDKVGIMVRMGTTNAAYRKMLKHACKSHYIVRIPALRKLDCRPRWKGELAHEDFRIEMNQARNSGR